MRVSLPNLRKPENSASIKIEQIRDKLKVIKPVVLTGKSIWGGVFFVQISLHHIKGIDNTVAMFLL